MKTSRNLPFLLFFWISFVFAQEKQFISLTEFKEKIEQNNRSLKANDEEYLKLRADFRATQASFLPQLSASHSAYRTDNPVMAFGTLLNQGIFAESDFAINNLNNPSAVSNFITTFQVQQPLINFDKLMMRSALKASTNAQLQQNTFKKEALLLQADRLYMQLQLAYKSVAVLEKAKATTETNLKSMEDFFEEGLLIKSDVLSAKVRLNEVENALNKARNEVQYLSDYMHYMMNEEGAVLIPENKLEVQISATSDHQNLEGRSDILAMDLKVEATQKMKQSAGLEYLPTLNAIGNVQYFDQDVFGTGAQNFFVGATLQWNLFEGGSRIAKNQKTKAQYERAKLEADDYKAAANVELEKAKRAVVEAENKLNRNTLSLEQAQEAYQIRKNRFDEGLERPTDLLNAEVQLANQELYYNQAIFEFNLAQLQVQFLGNAK